MSSPIYLETVRTVAITRMVDKLVVFHHQLDTDAGGDVAMDIDYKCVLLNLDRQRAVAVPDDIQIAAISAFPNLGLA